MQALKLYLLKSSRACYQRNYVPTNQENVGYPQTLTTNKNESTVNKRYKEWNFGTVYWLVVRKKKEVTYICI